MIIIFIGPPGSGKGTQAALVAHGFDIKHLSTGDVLRAKAREGGPDSDALNRIMRSGKLVPSSLINKYVIEALMSGGVHSCILDGYPRNVEQAAFLSENYMGNLKVVLFDVEDQLITKRLSGRFSCKACGKIYNKYFNPTKVQDVCDDCSSKEFTVREDDNVDVVTHRLEEYKRETLPVVEYYKNKVSIIDANRPVEEITRELLELLKSR